MARKATPQDLTITPRDRRFGRGAATARWWLGGNPYASALYNALSVTFPKGEAYFVESVRAFRVGARIVMTLREQDLDDPDERDTVLGKFAQVLTTGAAA